MLLKEKNLYSSEPLYTDNLAKLAFNNVIQKSYYVVINFDTPLIVSNRVG